MSPKADAKKTTTEDSKDEVPREIIEASVNVSSQPPHFSLGAFVQILLYFVCCTHQNRPVVSCDVTNSNSRFNPPPPLPPLQTPMHSRIPPIISVFGQHASIGVGEREFRYLLSFLHCSHTGAYTLRFIISTGLTMAFLQ